ncbi:MAG: acetate--CoA ligase family protein [Anaerolineales bacterium]|nr:acetate--CoA ligase family protein [Anaerolineales bacterium]
MEYGIPIPEGRVATTAAEAKQITVDLGKPVVLKAQVMVRGRGKAGGIRLAKNPMEAEELASNILGSKIKEMPVHRILVDEVVNIQDEFFLGIVSNPETKTPVIVASKHFNFEDLDEFLKGNPETVFSVPVNPMIGLQNYQIRETLFGLEMNKKYHRTIQEITQNLWRMYTETEAISVEINPLAITTDGRLLAVDGSIDLDDVTLFRQVELSEKRDVSQDSADTLDSRKYNLQILPLKGEIGCISNGIGLALLTIDMIEDAGGRCGTMVELSGANDNRTAAAINILLGKPEIKVIFINIYGGITNTDQIALGIKRALGENAPSIPIVCRIKGSRMDDGLKILKGLPVILCEEMDQAIQKLVTLTTEGKGK